MRKRERSPEEVRRAIAPSLPFATIIELGYASLHSLSFCHTLRLALPTPAGSALPSVLRSGSTVSFLALKEQYDIDTMFLSRTQHALPHYAAESGSVASNSGELDVSFETGANSSASDGRMGYGAFNDDLKTPERVRTTSLSLAPPRSSLKASPPSLFPSFADFVRVPLSSQLGSKGENKGWIRSEDECGSRALKTPDCSRNSNTESHPEAPSPLVGVRTHSYPRRDSDFTFNPFDTPDEVLEARRSDSHPLHPSASGPFASSAQSYTALPATRARISTPQSTNCYAQQAEYSYPLPVTPPHTPFRSASMPLHQAPHPPHAMHSLPPSPPPYHPPHFYPSLPRQRTYPLSQVEAEAVAHAHNGRVPSLLQLAPPSDSDHAPIINTGNQGPMIVQQGDWSCGVCGFVVSERRSAENRRRRLTFIAELAPPQDLPAMLPLRERHRQHPHHQLPARRLTRHQCRSSSAHLEWLRGPLRAGLTSSTDRLPSATVLSSR